MKLGDGFPVVLLSHRKQEFLPKTIDSLRRHLRGAGELVVVDDSGDEGHYAWLDSHYNGSYSLVEYGRNSGYLNAVNKVWEVSRNLADEVGVDYILLWEEDFVLERPVQLSDLSRIMDGRDALAQLNLQRQPVYKIERRYGYMESHQRRGYGLVREDGWVLRERPFTMNPGLIRRDVLDLPWPSREVCDNIDGGAEPAMSIELEGDGWYFGWYGKWNQRHATHVGVSRKSGHSY